MAKVNKYILILFQWVEWEVHITLAEKGIVYRVGTSSTLHGTAQHHRYFNSSVLEILRDIFPVTPLR